MLYASTERQYKCIVHPVALTFILKGVIESQMGFFIIYLGCL